MGLFSSEKTISVSSTVYNLAGDEDQRPQVMQSLVLRSVLSNEDVPFAKRLQETLTRGSGMAQRRFYRWAIDNYDLGMPEGTISGPDKVDASVVQSGVLPLLGLGPNESLQVISAEVDGAEIQHWAEAWMNQNRPEVAEDDWLVNYDTVNDSITIIITGEAVVYLGTPNDLAWATAEPERQLLYVAYRKVFQDPDTLEITIGPGELFTYRMGTGNVVFDNLVPAGTSLPEFFPAVPLRLWNKSIRHADHSDKFDNIQRGFRKLTGKDVNTLLDQIEENEDLDEIDFAFMVQGVNLSTKDQVGQEYAYLFLKDLMASQQYGKGVFENHLASQKLARRGDLPLATFYNAHDFQGADRDRSYGSYPNFGNNPPPPPVYTPAKSAVNRLRIRSPLLDEFDVRLEWSYIEEHSRVGNGKTFDGNQTRGKMKVGEYWFRKGDSFTTYIKLVQGEDGNRIRWRPIEVERVYLVHQYERLRYRELEIVGLVHRNNVYKNRTADTSTEDAISARDSDEESGFVIPLHYPTLQKLSMVQRTQLSTVSSYLVFNSYVITEVKWYEKSVFKFILVVAALALTLPTGGASLGASVGILGANAAVGAAIGASAATAAVIGAVANYVAAMVLSQLIQWGSRELIGGKWGEIIGAVVSFVAMAYAGQYARSGDFNLDWSQLMRAENMLKLTNSVSDAYSRWMMSDTQDIMSEVERVREEYADRFEEIEELSDEILGMTSGLIDPMMFTDANEYFGEPREAFLSRTLLTGSDIANLTHAMIENFADITLELPRARSAPSTM